MNIQSEKSSNNDGSGDDEESEEEEEEEEFEEEEEEEQEQVEGDAAVNEIVEESEGISQSEEIESSSEDQGAGQKPRISVGTFGAQSIKDQQHSLFWDERCGFKPTPASQILHWSKFNSNIFSDTISPEQALAGLEGHEDEWIDLRPYMIELPIKLSRFNTLSKALEQF